MIMLVIAAAGGLGRRVVQEALSRGHAVHALARDATKLREALGAETIGRLAGVHVGDGSDVAAVRAAAAGVHAIVSAAVPDPRVAKAVGEVAKDLGLRAVWVAGASNLKERDGVTWHHESFGPRGLGFFNAHAPCIDALRATGAKSVIFCPGFMKGVGRKTVPDVEIHTHAVPGSVATMDFISYEDAASVIVRAALESGDRYDGGEVTGLTPGGVPKEEL